jgi:hypothetical protein
MTASNENPYQSPFAPGTRLSRRSNRKRFFLGCIVLAPISLILGRMLIAPDDLALRFSLGAFPVVAVLWGAFIRRRKAHSIDSP